MNLGSQMADISVNNQMTNFNTGPYGKLPLKIKILKIGLRHVLSWPVPVVAPRWACYMLFCAAINVILP